MTAPANRAARRGRLAFSASWKLAAISVASVLAFLALWQIAGTAGWINPLLLPPLGEVLRTTLDLAENGYRQSSLWHHIGISVARAGSAFVAAIAIGVPVGLLMGRTPWLAAVLDPFVQFLRPLPKIALIPLVVVWFGIGEGSKFFLIFISTLLSVLVGSAAAVLNVGQQRIRAAATLGASRHQIFWHVILPNALPEIFTTIRLAIGIGWTSLIAAELVAAESGLGWMVLNAGTYLRTDVVMVGIFLLGLIGYLFDAALVLLQRRLVPWAGKDA
ncbi:ABC transporter permease subunit [Corticibacter populi]|uniref:ABC transporter permease subunit n=1 Tax=Corticibacter populi TaxID=1550736 RepID=A0A3M6QQQ4_9BURK|nr:ABC transporter permease subunit [Corticibacter populi]RMX04889.1 ABC transporter permease subunit [Corticibacter populi]RZS33688.1 taurine transport system permease protein [Corticibacter populi]